MILIWNDAESFQQHLEDMKEFRRSHHEPPVKELALVKHLPAPHDIQFPCNVGGGNQLIKNSSKTLIVPIWKIVLAQGSQN